MWNHQIFRTQMTEINDKRLRLGQADLTPPAWPYLLSLKSAHLKYSRIMIQSSRFPSLLLSALFALAFVAVPLLPARLPTSHVQEIELPAHIQHSVVRHR